MKWKDAQCPPLKNMIHDLLNIFRGKNFTPNLAKTLYPTKMEKWNNQTLFLFISETKDLAKKASGSSTFQGHQGNSRDIQRVYQPRVPAKSIPKERVSPWISKDDMAPVVTKPLGKWDFKNIQWKGITLLYIHYSKLKPYQMKKTLWQKFKTLRCSILWCRSISPDWYTKLKKKKNPLQLRFSLLILLILNSTNTSRRKSLAWQL